MRISGFIKELLFENEYVIVPDFGAFVSNYKSAQIDEEQGVYYPPSKEISFNAKLKNNDRVLVNFIIEKARIREYAAVKEIEAFRENIQYQLDNGEKVEIEGLGFLYTDSSNAIQFESAPSENLLRESYGLQTVSLKEETDPAAGVVPVKTKSKRKKKGYWWLILIPVIVAAIFIYLNIVMPAEEYPTTPELEENEPELIADTVAIKDSIQPDSVVIATQDTVTPEVEAKPTGKMYYLVGGSFTARENADKYFNRITKMGYQPVYMGKQGKFHIVAIGTYMKGSDAIAAKREFLSKEPESGVWILEGK